MLVSDIVAQAVHPRGELTTAGTQTLTSQRPVKEASSPQQTTRGKSPGGSNRASSRGGAGRRPVRLNDTLSTTSPTKKGGLSFCAQRNINVLPLDRIQRGVFVTHHDRLELQRVEAAESEHRRDIEEAMQHEYDVGFTFLSHALSEMVIEVLETRAEMVQYESRIRALLIEEEEMLRVPISHERCRAEYSWKYLEQILKRGSIIEDDMKRERKMTMRKEDQTRKWLAKEFVSIREGIEKKEAANIRHMNIQATCFARAATNFHQVVYDLKMERAQSRQGSRGGYGATSTFSPMSTLDYSTAGYHSPDDVMRGDALPPPRPFTSSSATHIDDGGGIDGVSPVPTAGNPLIPTTELVASVISPMSPVSGTKKHSLRRTQYIQEYLASRPALYTKKDYASPSRRPNTSSNANTTATTTSYSPSGSPAKRSAAGTDWTLSNSQQRASTSHAQSRRQSSSALTTQVDTTSLAPVIPYWLYRRSTIMDLQQTALQRLQDVAQYEYLAFPTAAFSPAVQAAQGEPEPSVRLQQLQSALEEAELAEAESDSVESILTSIELALTAASALCTIEDPQRSIVIVSEALMKLDSLLKQRPTECDAVFFKLLAVAFHNAAMALAMLPEEITGGGSSLHSGGPGERSAASRRASRRSISRGAGGDDDPLGRRVTPVEMIQLTVGLSATAFGHECAFTKHLQSHALANVIQLDVLPPAVLPPATTTAKAARKKEELARRTATPKLAPFRIQPRTRGAPKPRASTAPLKDY